MRIKYLSLAAIIAVCLVFPPIVWAQEQDLTDLFAYVPPKYAGSAFALWCFLFYIVGPLMKRYGTRKDGTRTRLGRIGEFVTQDSHRPPPAPPTLLLLGALMLAPSIATAQETEAPGYLGCFPTKSVGPICVGASASLSLLSYKVSDDRIMSGFRLSPGIGAAIFSDRWYTTGLSVALVMEPRSDDTPVHIGGILSFAKYARVGFASGGRVIFGIGVGP